MVVKDLRVLLLLSRGVGEDLLQYLQLLLLAGVRGKGVPVAGLALPGEGAEEVFFRDAVFEFHRNAPFQYEIHLFSSENFLLFAQAHV